MTKREQVVKDRRQDYAQRLRHAVKKAHDPVFTVPKPERATQQPEPSSKS